MRNLDTCIQTHARQTPEKTAITFYDQKISYAELLNGYLSMAANLSAYGLSPGDVVALMCERNADLVMALLAVLKLDCVFLPVDKLNPKQRIEYILSNSGTKLVITDEDLDLPAKWQQVNVKISSLKGTSGCGLAPIAREKSENSRFCIMYTSGTTGRPKGTILTKKSMYNTFYEKIDYLPLTSESIVAQDAGYYFVNSLWQIFTPFIIGAEIVIYDRHIMNDLPLLVNKLYEDRISVFQAVPSFFNKFFEYVRQGQYHFENLRCLLCTGDKLNYPLVEKCFDVFHGIKLINCYGQTECSDDVTQYTLEATPDEQDIPIGSPIRNTRIYVIDADNGVSAPMKRGEIYIAGAAVSDGYLNAPDLTSLAFIKGSALGLEEEVLYRTGDIGYQREDGNVIYLGRKDFQVKIAGYRVELYEIENVMLQYPGIHQAAVIYVEEVRKLIAFYLESRAITQDALIAFLKSMLPSYMIPREFIRVEAFPLTAMEKIDRKQLQNGLWKTGMGLK